MKLSKFNKSYYRYKIILTFSIVTFLLIIVLSQISYSFIKSLYTTQISENLKNNLVLTFEQIDKIQLDILQSEITTNSTVKYFSDLFNRNYFKKIFSEIFIFDKELKIAVHSNKNYLVGKVESRLLLNEVEINTLKQNQTFITLPFQGNDNNWYLWGFYRLSDNHWLAVKDNVNNFAKLEELSNIFLYFGIFGIIISILLGFWVSKSLTDPIHKLVYFSSEIGKENYSSNIPENLKGELKILSDALVKMRDNIKDNQNEKEKILAQIAHEIRNPLGGIELLANLINESPTNEHKNQEYTTRIIGEINNLKKLITSYLNFSRPTPANFELISINELVNESLEILKYELDKKNITVNYINEYDTINFDRHHFRNILLNLIKNSIESIAQNGEINIYSTCADNKVSIKIEDNGSGIEEKDLPKLFEPFFTTKSNGTGLGLATCKKYCLENKAEISVEIKNKRTTFTIIKNIQ
ncbi:MAG: HAMP domain-containing histidine kinase [Ignavibacteriae bacterium]|nr:HAMP domain-containing histidine kinase [Ignavibacteriota bacterium]